MTRECQVDPFGLRSELLGALPIVNHFLDRLGIDDALAHHLGPPDARWRVSPAKALGALIRNLVVDHRPLYGLGEWAAPHHPGVLGLAAEEVGGLNDDRVGRALDVLFDADRASLLSMIVLRAIARFDIDCRQLHNDSTSITFTGAYAEPRGRGGRAGAKITYGYNKDHRPDLQQLVWILTVTADGAVPIAHRVESGNTTDDTTHIASWEQLAALLGRRDFLYVADSKLCTRDQMDHIDGAGGRFVTVLPRTRREDRSFRDWISRNQPHWTEAMRRSARRRGDRPDVLSTYEGPVGSADGHRIIWVRSSSKQDRDASYRIRRINHATAALEDLTARLTGPKCRIKTRVAAVEAAEQALADHDAARYFDIFVAEHVDKTYKADHRGRPGSTTTFRQVTKSRFTLTFKVRAHVVKAEAASDGCFPLITNDTDLSPAEILAVYKHQPHLERRHHLLKSVQSVAPVFLHSPARIEALLTCQFLALLIHALIERAMREAMAERATGAITLYPEDRACPSPSASRILTIFDGLTRHHLVRRGRMVQSFEPTLTRQQRDVLSLLGIPTRAYRLA
jgi:transposase